MTPFELLAVAYFVVVLAAAPRVAARRRGVLYVCGAVALIIVARFTLPWTARAWLAHAYLVLGYWIPAAFVGTPNAAFERWLARADAHVGAWLVPGTYLVPASRLLLELAYLCCYPLVPAGFIVVWLFGSAEDVNWFWTVVLASGYACYISLPWTAARPPRLAEPRDGAPLPRGLTALNVAVLGRVSHQLVTFPSGHVAVAVAVAIATWRVWPAAGVTFGVLALLIAAAAVAGRYHYAIDVLCGLIVGAVIPFVAQSI